MPLLMAKAEVGVAVAEPETPIAQALDLAMAPAIPMIVLLRVLLLLVDLVRVLVVAVGKVMINMPQVTEEGVHLAQAMVTPVIFTVMGLPMQMGVGAAAAPEEVLATAKGMVMVQEMGKVLPTAMDHMVQATPIVEEAEVEGVVVMMVDLAVVLARGQEAAMELLGVDITMMAMSVNHHKRLANHHRPLVIVSANHHRPLMVVPANHHWLIKMYFVLEQW